MAGLVVFILFVFKVNQVINNFVGIWFGSLTNHKPNQNFF